jgi:hypothetical protein
MNAAGVWSFWSEASGHFFVGECDLRWCSLSATRTQTEAAARWISLWLFFIGKPLAAQPNVANWDLLAAQWHFEFLWSNLTVCFLRQKNCFEFYWLTKTTRHKRPWTSLKVFNKILIFEVTILWTGARWVQHILLPINSKKQTAWSMKAHHKIIMRQQKGLDVCLMWYCCRVQRAFLHIACMRIAISFYALNSPAD